MSFFRLLALLKALRAIFENNGLSYTKRERQGWKADFKKSPKANGDQFEKLAKSSLKQGIPQASPFMFQKR